MRISTTPCPASSAAAEPTIASEARSSWPRLTEVNEMTVNKDIDRRSFLKATLVAGGVLVFGINLPTRSRAAERFNLPAEPAADFQPNAFIKIAPDGKVT